jgi:uncharacterized protein
MGVTCVVMLAVILTSVLIVAPADLAADSKQTAPPVVTGSVAAKLSPDEIFDLQKRADSGDAAAQYALGRAYEHGNGVPLRADQAAIWYRKAAEQGNDKAQNGLGVLYWFGEGVERDKTEAVRWYRKAARQGNADAMFNLGAAYYNGEGVGPDDNLAFAWFLLSSEAGNSSGQDAAKRSKAEHNPADFAYACVTIGQMYLKGDDLSKNTTLAASWYRKAAEKGSGDAALHLGALYLDTSDYTQARPWCEAASKQRLGGAYWCLGYLYQHGYAVAENPKEAFHWYEQGAHERNEASMLALAHMYENGAGTKPDRIQAFVWYLLAAERGDKSAAAEAKRIRSSMTQKEWKDTKKKLPISINANKVESFLQGNPQPTNP